MKGGGSNTTDWKGNYQSQKNLSSWPSNCRVTGTHQEPNQPPAEVLRFNMTNFPFKKTHNIFPLSLRQSGISRSKKSCLQGSTVNTHAGLSSSQLCVSTSASGRRCHVSVPKDTLPVEVSDWVSRVERWLWLSRMPCSLHHSEPIFDSLAVPKLCCTPAKLLLFF